MDKKFNIRVDSRRHLVRIEMHGFFTVDDVSDFKADLRTKSAALSCGPNEHLTICDVRKMNIQSQDAVAAFSTIVGSDEFRSKRLALVTGSTLARLQAERLKDREGVEYFSDVDPAIAWLLELPPRPDQR